MKATSSMKHQGTKAQNRTILMPLNASGQRAVQALPPGKGCARCVWETEHTGSPAPGCAGEHTPRRGLLK